MSTSMSMSSRCWLASATFCMALASGCGSNSDERALDASHGGDEGDGSTAMSEPPNPYCPTRLGPTEGPYAQRGECCYRADNTSRVEAQGDAPAVIVEYRINDIQTINQPASLGLDLVRSVMASGYDNGEMNLLWRITGPRENGELTSGRGTAQVGAGRYNCDEGTYSFYGDGAAPTRGEHNDPARWKSVTVPITFDPSAPQPRERIVPDWDGNANRHYTLIPYLNSGDYGLEWELVSQGFAMEDVPTDNASLDCIGSRAETGGWTPGGTFVFYNPLKPNDVDPIGMLSGQTYCQLLAFGVVEPTAVQDDAVSCAKAKRCKPGTSHCKWVKLPDGLCPDPEKGEDELWGCHIGDTANADGEPTNCTAEAPTTALNPATGAKSEGQCCDPLGESTTLPACNAYFLRNKFAAAGAEITDDAKNEAQPNCHE